MKKRLAVVLYCFIATMANAQIKLPSWLNNVKVSGYGITQFQYSSQENAKSNTFNLRMARVSLDGRILNDFYWKTQVQFNGNTSTLGSSPRIVDLFAEWQKYDYFRIKLGQFKRPFSFENPMHPIDQGFMSYGQVVTKLVGFNDRNGSHASNGRDLGIQLQGDLLKNKHDRNLIHYQIGVFNGQGINVKDVDQQKDIIGGIWVMPVLGMRIGAFGWTGSYSRKGTWQDDMGNTLSGIRKLKQCRYAFSAEYKVDDWTFRSEYIHSTGNAFKTTYQTTETKDCTLSADGDKADGVYMLAIVPITKNKLHAKARYDMYRPTAEWNKARTQYEIGLDYEFAQNLKISGEYAFINDRSLSTDHNYNMVDIQLSFRF